MKIDFTRWAKVGVHFWSIMETIWDPLGPSQLHLGVSQAPLKTCLAPLVAFGLGGVRVWSGWETLSSMFKKLHLNQAIQDQGTLIFLISIVSADCDFRHLRGSFS